MLFLLQVAGQTPIPLPMPNASGWEDPITVATLVIAASTVVSVVVSGLMWKAMRRQTQLGQDIFEAAHRPYVGVLKLEGSMSHQGAGNPVALSLFALIKNAGTIPAFELTARWIIKAGPNTVERVQPEIYPMSLLPESEQYMRTNYALPQAVFKEYERGLMLDITLTLEYQGVAEKKYRYEQQATCDHMRGYVMRSAKSTEYD